jgi:dolichyl-phosphate-mannose-protein mannosyltransferase
VRRWITEHSQLLIVLAGALGIRLALAALPGFESDVGFFRLWAEQISASGPGNFFAVAVDPSKDYAPGYLYVLWFLGDLNSIFHFTEGQWDYVLKLPPIAADLGSAVLLYLLVRQRSEDWGLLAAAVYLVLPPVLLIGAIWGQVDSLLAFFVLLAIYFLAGNRPVAAGLAFTAGFFVKPQIVAVLPFFAFWLVRDAPPRTWLRVAGWSTVLAIALAWPFFPSLLPWRPLHELSNHLQGSVDKYPYNSVFADNLWTVFPDFAGRCDVKICHDPITGGVQQGSEYLGLTTRTWGLALYLLSSAVVIGILRRTRSTAFLALGTSLCALAFFVFMTRMHERYLFPFFLPALVACSLLRSAALWRAFAVLATVHFLNLYDVYVSFGDLRIASVDDWLESRDLWGTGLDTSQALAIVVCTSFAALLVETRRLARDAPGTMSLPTRPKGER